MAFEHFTRCIEPVNFVPRSYAVIAGQAGIVASLGLPLAIGHPICLIIVGEIFGLAFIIAYCRNWLYGRLICLGGDKAVIGAVISVSPPPGVFTFDWDNDYSINLLLANTEFGVTQDVAQESVPFGELIKHQDVITNPPVSRDTLGHFGTDIHGTGKKTFGLHAEFEGAGNFNLMQVAEGMLGVAVGAYLLCLIAPFPIDLILALFVLLGSLLGITVSKFVRPGSPSDVNPHLPTIHVNDEDNNGHGKGADVLFVQGTWVFDPLHQGWNEFHPIKACTKIGCWKGDWTDSRCGDGPSPPPTPVLLLRLQQAFQVAQSGETLANQKRPEHQWHFHPVVDGCAPDIIL
jgi:hypothetical protein